MNAQLTHKRFEVPAAVFVKRKGMKQAWCLASSRADANEHEIVRAYSKRFTIEERFATPRTSSSEWACRPRM